MSPRRHLRSLRQRVALVAIAVLGVWVIVLTIGVNVLLDRRLDSQADQIVTTRAQAALATVQVGSDGTLTLLEGTDDSALDTHTWIFQGRDAIEVPSNTADLLATAAAMTQRGAALTTTGGSAGIRWSAEPVLLDGIQVGTVIATTSLAPYAGTRELTLVATIALAVLLLAGAYFALRVSIGRALLPVDAMTRQAEEWSADDVERRFGTGNRPVELAALAGHLDAVLDRLAAVLRHEKQLSAEISHELRTPLARLSAETQLLARDSDATPGIRAALHGLNDDIAEISSILEILFAAARQQSTTPNGRCDAVTVVRDIAARRHRPPPVRSPTGPVGVGVDASLLARALIPLLDNADRYARSEVGIEIVADGGVVRIAVIDDGPGIPLLDLPYIFEPGRRGSTDDGHQGAGLGLALARRLVQAAGGTITAATTATGAVLTVILPTA